MGAITTGVVPRSVAFVENGGTGALPAISFPTSANGGFPLQLNETMILTVYVNSGTAGTVTTPSGWTPVNASKPTSGNSGTFWQFQKTVTATELNTASITVTTSYTNGPIAAWLTTYSNVKVSAPIGGSSISASTNNTTRKNLPGAVTPVTPGSIALLFCSNSNSAVINGEDVPSQYASIGATLNDTYNAAGFHGPLGGDTSPVNSAPAWVGQYSQFQMASLLTLISPADFVPVPILPSERASIAAAFGLSTVEASVASPSFAAITVVQALQAIAAVTYGVNANSATSSPTYYDASGNRQRLTGTLDGSLNRTGTTLSFS